MKHNDFIQQIISQLPENLHTLVNELSYTIFEESPNLKIILVGAFSVGKSSLLNALLNEDILQVAMEETTALPTFIEFNGGNSPKSMQLVFNNGDVKNISEEEFKIVTTHAPENAAFAELRMPLQWLNNVSIIDLPGLGSVSTEYKNYTIAQIKQADAVLYLLNPVGPSENDVIMINEILNLGKSIQIMVAKYDIITAAEQRGEKSPSLLEWQQQIVNHLNKLNGSQQLYTINNNLLKLYPCNKNGLGKDDVLNFFNTAKNNLHNIRLNRFKKMLLPLLQNELSNNIDHQKICEAQTEEAMQQVHTELIQRKQKMLEFKSKLYSEQNNDKEKINIKCNQIQQQEKIKLNNALTNIANSINDVNQWDDFTKQGSNALKTSLHNVATQFSQLSTRYGKIENLTEGEITEFKLHLPEPEVIDANDFLDNSKLKELQNALDQHQKEYSLAEQKLNETNIQLEVIDTNETQKSYRQLVSEKNKLQSLPLPKIIEEAESKGFGSMIGRTIGEFADLALMFIAPSTIAGKAASYVGKGAKAMKLTTSATKVAKAVRPALTTALQVSKAGQVGGKAAARGFSNKGGILDKLQGLEVLSVGYWGEKICSFFDTPQPPIIKIDEEAKAERDAEISEINQKIAALKKLLVKNEKLIETKEMSQWAMEKSQKEQQFYQQRIADLSNKAQQQADNAMLAQQQDIKKQFLYQVDKAKTQWLRNYDNNVFTMNDLMYNRIKDYWETYVADLLNQRIAEVEELDKQSNISVIEKQQLVKQLKDDAEKIITVQKLL